MLDIQSQIDAWHVQVRNVLAGLADELTIGSSPILDTRDNRAWLDVAITIDSEEGSRRAGAKATLRLELTALVHAADPEVCFLRAPRLLQAAIGRLDADDDLYVLQGAGTTYQSGPTEAGGSFGYVVQAVRSFEWRIDSRPGNNIGLNVDSAADMDYGSATSVSAAKTVEPEKLSAVTAPSDVTFFYANAEIGDTVELLDMAGTVQGSVAIAVAGLSRATFQNVNTPGEYRARLGDYTSKLTALVISAP